MKAQGDFCNVVYLVKPFYDPVLPIVFQIEVVNPTLYSLIVVRDSMYHRGLPHGNGVNTLWARQNGRRFADDTFKRIFLNENDRISIKISLKLVPKVPIYNIPVLVQIMAWRRPGDKPLSEPMAVWLMTHIYVTRPQWVNIIHQC